MVGQDRVKMEFEAMIDAAAMDLEREAKGLAVPKVGRHMIFAGPPGTGKTTVARGIADAFWALGLVPERKFKDVQNASELIHPILGKTPGHVREIFDQARGGVLFVDEFYTLVDSAKNNGYGGEALTELMTLMDNHRDDTVVIFGGYGESPDGRNRVEELFQFNEGFRSRFSNKVNFDPYDADELAEILPLAAEDKGLVLDKKVLNRALSLVSVVRPDENGRGVRNLVERAYKRLNTRLAQMPEEKRTVDALQTLRLEDFADDDDDG